MSFATHLECPKTGERLPVDRPQNLSSIGAPLLVRYDLAAVEQAVSKADLVDRPKDIWRFRELLPVEDYSSVATLGEGWSPLLDVPRLAKAIGLERVLIKDEGFNPTGTFKARGAALGVTRAKELGIRQIAMPTAGNAGSAWAAYCARAGLDIHIVMPTDAPLANQQEVSIAGASLYLVDGLISDAGRIVGRAVAERGWFDASTLKEPYRIEGKKTMGLEIAEQLDWDVPDVILYPAGGGVGLIGIWKALDELEAIGWIGSKRPRLVCVQAAGCAPLVKAWNEGATESVFWEGAHTIASGLRVPKALGDFLVLQALRETSGTAVAVSDEDGLAAMRQLAATEGMWICPEGATCVHALAELARSGWVKPRETAVILNTGVGVKYPETYQPEPRARLRPTDDLP
ncbi:MAG: threonine synthase [Chloroflexi bacterium]|nr:threonine synthase [Chloroflexota bacterium]